MKNQTKKKIKVLRIDNWGEFYGKEFKQLCKQCGIARHIELHIHPSGMGLHVVDGKCEDYAQ